MSTSPPDRRPVTTALATMIATVTGRPCGDGEPPADNTLPYYVVHEIPGGGYSGPPFHAPDADATFVYQVDAVAERRDQAAWAADAARQALLGRGDDGVFAVAIPVDGHAIKDRRPDGAGGVDREGARFTAYDRYTVDVTRSS